MERIIQVKQILSFEVTPEMEDNVSELLVYKRLALALAALAQGFVHVDGVGFLEPDGTLLIEDEDAIRADLK
jgi:hypothetical protein